MSFKGVFFLNLNLNLNLFISLKSPQVWGHSLFNRAVKKVYVFSNCSRSASRYWLIQECKSSQVVLSGWNSSLGRFIVE